MNKSTIIQKILKDKAMNARASGSAFAPVNIALCKYWGKRNTELNLPQNSSLSIALSSKGAFTRIVTNNENNDLVYANDKLLEQNSSFVKKLTTYLDLFRSLTKTYYTIHTTVDVPIAAGLASSACGYAALILALDNLYNWRLDRTQLSILARLGSGSACRSLWKGFVKWSAGERNDGMDSCGEEIKCNWPELRIGLLLIEAREKPIPSRQAMQNTVATSSVYPLWLNEANKDIIKLEQAIANKDFVTLGKTAESNALLMHETMQKACPPINYSLPETLRACEKIKQLRQTGVEVYFTQDAGPNLKLLFLAPDTQKVFSQFPEIEILAPFTNSKQEEVILVDENDKAIGVEEKLSAHKNRNLHRAFSIFVFRRINGKVELLLQQRNQDKYHAGGLWSNTCCSHPRPDEDVVSAAKRRLQEEMGFAADLLPVGKFNYIAKFPNGLIENEVDHVLASFISTDNFSANPKEVQNHKWMALDDLKLDVATNPQNYTPWLAQALEIAQSNVHNLILLFPT